MRVSRELLDEIVAHAREEAPKECCGLLGTKGDTVTSVYRAENEFANTMSFRIPSGDQIRIFQEAEERGEEVIVSYHSHPASEAKPSQTDINEASHFGPSARTLMGICSLADVEPVFRLFAIQNRELEELDVDVTND